MLLERLFRFEFFRAVLATGQLNISDSWPTLLVFLRALGLLYFHLQWQLMHFSACRASRKCLMHLTMLLMRLIWFEIFRTELTKSINAIGSWPTLLVFLWAHPCLIYFPFKGSCTGSLLESAGGVSGQPNYAIRAPVRIWISSRSAHNQYIEYLPR